MHIHQKSVYITYILYVERDSLGITLGLESRWTLMGAKVLMNKRYDKTLYK